MLEVGWRSWYAFINNVKLTKQQAQKILDKAKELYFNQEHQDNWDRMIGYNMITNLTSLGYMDNNWYLPCSGERSWDDNIKIK